MGPIIKFITKNKKMNVLTILIVITKEKQKFLTRNLLFLNL